MKGPHERLKYDLRRLWECPACKHRERTPGTVTFRHCQCQMKQPEGRPVVMKLVEDGVQRIGPPIVIEHEPLEAMPPPLPPPPAVEPTEPPAA
jgi:hypothetical protein